MSKVIPLFKTVYLPEMDQAVADVLRSGQIASGRYVEEFESGLREITGHSHIVSTSDMTSALRLALHLSGVGDGDEVITSPFACLSTNAAIANSGGRAVWTDFIPDSVEIDVDDLIAKITARTKAVILYHVAGYPGNAKRIAEVCKSKGIFFIEDCNNALLASRDGLPVGAWGDFSVYSFYPNRQIHTTEGGALGCRDEGMAVRAKKLKRFGIDSSNFRNSDGEINSSSDIPEIGWSMSMNNLCAAVGCTQFDSLHGRQIKTQENVNYLKSMFDDHPSITVVPVADNAVSAYWVFLVFVERKAAVIAHMKRNSVMVSGLHQNNFVYSGFHSPERSLNVAPVMQDKLLAIPCGWWLDRGDMEQIAHALRQAVLAY